MSPWKNVNGAGNLHLESVRTLKGHRLHVSKGGGWPSALPETLLLTKCRRRQAFLACKGGRCATWKGDVRVRLLAL